jgi:hypothetical protein
MDKRSAGVSVARIALGSHGLLLLVSPFLLAPSSERKQNGRNRGNILWDRSGSSLVLFCVTTI